MSTETGSKKGKKAGSKGDPTKEKPNMIQSTLPTKKQQMDSTATSMLSSAEKEDFGKKLLINVNS